MITQDRPDTRSLETLPQSTIAVARQAKHIVVVSCVATAAALTAAIVLANRDAGLSLAYLVFVTGAVGGIASNYRRLQRLLAGQVAGTEDRAAGRLVTYQVYLSPVVGGLFALLLYGVFMSGTLVQGGVAPSFVCAADKYESLAGFAECGPSTNADVAKTLIWAFAAGFVEMLVPNFITTLTRSVGSSGE